MRRTILQFKVLATLLFAVAANSALSQCSSLYYFQKGKVVKMAIYTKGDELSGEMVYTVQNIESAGKGTKATVQSEYFNKKGKKIMDNTANYICSADTIKADMSTFIPSASQQLFKNAKTTIEATNLSYPSKLKDGQTLPDGSFTATTDMGMFKQSVSVNITDRKVIGKETITAAGKSWDCYKISYTCTIAVKSMISSKHDIHTTEWYAPSFGVLKTDSGDAGRTEVTSISN
ncbi:MAG: hypothetical protein JWQ79_1424 [Mucilaginibacter sp.]|nr:hypothetical protein [Mucilaginibacter sp.]